MTRTNTNPSPVEPIRVSPALLDHLLAEHVSRTLPRLERLWDYYRNPLTPVANEDGGISLKPAQRRGLPARLRKIPAPSLASPMDSLRNGVGGREQVIENDIAWRLHTLVDFMFGRMVSIQSLAPDADRAAAIEAFLRAVFDANGGITFFQDLGLLGGVYGYVDVLLRIQPDNARRPGEITSPIPSSVLNAGSPGFNDPATIASCFVLETIEAPRAIALLNPEDYRRLDAYIVHVRQATHELEADHFLSRVRRRIAGAFDRPDAGPGRAVVEHTQVWTAQGYERYENRSGTSPFARGLAQERRELVASGPNVLGRIPVVHIQNLPQPFFYEGLSEVEPLIPLQDELNTRLSDRANRVTFQSFKMYLGKGIEHFNDRPVGPGQMWATDNPDASIEEFGGDGANPSETQHITEIREALDKASSVSPLAAGVIRDKIGNLTSENALRITMMGLLAKTMKKRIAYGTGIERLCEMILHAADVTGLMPNAPEERRVRLDWPDPLPSSENQALANARIKLELGVPQKQILAELGYEM